MDFGIATELYPEDYGFQPDIYNKPQPQPDMLAVIQLLHASLDPRTVFACFGKTVGQFLPIQGVHLQVEQRQFHWGKHHGISMQRITEQDNQRLSFHYRLQSPLTHSQVKLLANIERMLLQPLVNALKYQTMSQQAMFDTLTQLGNRHYYNQTIAKSLAKASRKSQANLALIIFDIDNFKQLNDSYGHSFGDTVLQEFSSLLSGSIRDSDQGFRIGGDEFVVIVDGDNDAASILCERLTNAMEQHQLLCDYKVQTSMGIAIWEPKLTAKEMYDRADIALYQAKAAGRNCYRSFKEG